ncbi:hypothetical protein BR93DRAFT_734261 [Coniochaeta sp. PMI_546]|nr:hypothetical protein BR93DRAFT_734261 [Coniochaeta sp. PMI_546]
MRCYIGVADGNVVSFVNGITLRYRPDDMIEAVTRFSRFATSTVALVELHLYCAGKTRSRFIP